MACPSRTALSFFSDLLLNLRYSLLRGACLRNCSQIDGWAAHPRGQSSKHQCGKSKCERIKPTPSPADPGNHSFRLATKVSSRFTVVKDAAHGGSR